jgi:hypothetical protein
MKKEPKNYLAMVPVRKISEFSEQEGKVVLLVPKFKHVTFLNKLIPKNKPKHFRIHLDELGSKVWHLIDDKKTVQEICYCINDYLVANEKPSTQIEERVTQFLSQLYKSRFISFNEASHQLNG